MYINGFSGGVRGIWTLARFLDAYSLSRGAPSASWVSLRIQEQYAVHDYFGILTYYTLFVKDYFGSFSKSFVSPLISKTLTFERSNAIIWWLGEMSERFKEPVLKTGDGATHRGFESHSLRQKTTDSDRNLSFSTKCAFRRVKFASQVKLSYGQWSFCGSEWRT